MQKISKKGVTIKYKAEVASQAYKKAIERLNGQVSLIKGEYSMHLQKL